MGDARQKQLCAGSSGDDSSRSRKSAQHCLIPRQSRTSPSCPLRWLHPDCLGYVMTLLLVIMERGTPIVPRRLPPGPPRPRCGRRVPGRADARQSDERRQDRRRQEEEEQDAGRDEPRHAERAVQALLEQQVPGDVEREPAAQGRGD